MAYFDNDYNNADFYYPALPAPAPEEFDAYRFPRHEPATEEVNFPAHPTLDDQWGMARRPGSIVGEPTNYGNHQHNSPADWCLTRESPESVAPATSYAARAGDYGQPSYSGQYWSEVGQQTHSYPSGSLHRNVDFTGIETLEASAVGPAPSNVPLDYWWADQSGASTSTFYANVHSLYQQNTGPTRTELVPTRRFQPYGASRARQYGHRNAEAGPSTLVLPPVLQTPQPSGGISETTADAEPTNTATEQDKIPTSKRAKLPRGQGRIRGYRKRSQKDAAKLCGLIQQRKGTRELPSLNKALADVLEIIPTFRQVVNPEPCLFIKEGARTEPRSKSAKEERKRRDDERTLLKEFSRYYPLAQDQKTWGRPKLLLQVLKDVENLPAPPEQPNGSPPSTPTAAAAVPES